MTLPGPSASSSWWRRQRFYLIGAALFGVWAMYAPYRDTWREYARNRPSAPIDVAAGAQANYQRARWRFLILTERDAPKLREDAKMLVARFELILDAGNDAKSMGYCEARLTDARGRLWKSSDSPSLPGGRQWRLPTSCKSDFGPGATEIFPGPGKPWLFEQPFVVPRGIDVRTLRPEIFVSLGPDSDSAPGAYLRFTQKPL